ncbi:MAG: mechanosensitive ion channel [Pirellulaceae bacterium]|nr:mechanosensitive ion channel [Pirellulaceae bacterium]
MKLQSATGTDFESLKNQLSQSQLSEEEKTQIQEVLALGEKQANEAATKTAATAAKQAALDTIKQRVADYQDELEQLKDVDTAPIAAGSLPELEAALAQIESELAASQQAVTEADTAMAQASQRRRDGESELALLQKQVAPQANQVAAAEADSSLAATAKRAEISAAESLLQARIADLKTESALIDAEQAAGLPQLLRDLRAKQAEIKQRQYDSVKAAVEAERAKDAALRVQAAENQLLELHEALKPIGQQNQELATLNQKLTKEIEANEVTLATRSARLTEIKNAFEQAETRVATVGLTDAVGALLRNLKESLPNIAVYRLRSKERQPLINDAQFDLIDLTDRRNARLDVTIAALLRNAPTPLSSRERDELAAEARTLLEQQRTEFLDPAIRSQTAFFNSLVSLSTTEKQIVDLVDHATLYVNERVLWIRSTAPLYTQLVPDEDEWWFLHHEWWTQVPDKVVSEVSGRIVLWVLASIFLIALVRFRFRLREEIRTIGIEANQSHQISFVPTLKSLLLTVATAAPIPLVFGFIAWRFGAVAGNDRAMMALSQAASTVAYAYFPIELLRQVCRPKGLAESHFGFAAKPVSKLRRNLRWFLAITLPLLITARFLSVGGSGYGRYTLERYFYLAALVALTVLIARVLHPKRGIFADYLHVHPNGWSNRLSYIWYPLGVGIPIALGILSVVGYHFTSQQLGWRIFRSLGLLALLGLLMLSILRLAMVHRRKLRIEHARKRSSTETPAGSTEIPQSLLQESPTELHSQMNQTQRVLKMALMTIAILGMWFIWQDVLPALEQWTLWQSTSTITEVVTTDDGESIARTRDVPNNITIGNAGLVVLILFLTVAAVRNLPGLLEFAILRQLPLDNSIRYAITSLASYAIIMIGMVVSCKILGLRWQQIQWMATALTFGLAFGLQEVFANFIAGIIILFEQPIRVGDVVEIDSVTGVVTKIRIRATTITSWERKDFIVPNKDFITSKVLNWTRSDEVSRVVIDVGIAYGSDTDLARDLLVQAAKGHPYILEDPPTMAFFTGFGDSSLNFTLRAFINTYENRFYVLHDLHTAIDRSFRQANIEISFPQRDLHLRTVPEPIRRELESRSNDSADIDSSPGDPRG